MTVIRNNPVWTPALIEQDKALKEKYGPNAHVIPAKESDYIRMGLEIPKLQTLDSDLVEFKHKKENQIGNLNNPPAPKSFFVYDPKELKTLVNQRYNDFRSKYGEKASFNDEFYVYTNDAFQNRPVGNNPDNRVGGMTADGKMWDGYIIG